MYLTMGEASELRERRRAEGRSPSEWNRLDWMFRQKTGSVVCASCGSLVGVNDDKCYTCGRRNPGLWGFGPILRRFGNDLGFVSLVIYGCLLLYGATLVVSMGLGEGLMSGSLLGALGPGTQTLYIFGGSGGIPVF